MKLTVINASPKSGNSSSRALIRDFLSLYTGEAEEIPIHISGDTGVAVRAFSDLRREGGNALFVFPLYLDGIPSHLLRAMCEIAVQAQFTPPDIYPDTAMVQTEPVGTGYINPDRSVSPQAQNHTLGDGIKKPGIYAIINCGFCDGKNAETALSIMKNWSRRAGFAWKMGIGVGGCGGYSSSHAEIGHGIKRKIGGAMQKMIDIMQSESAGENIFTSTGYPPSLYRMGAHINFSITARKNHAGLFHNYSTQQ